jgi:hypothetical protein
MALQHCSSVVVHGCAREHPHCAARVAYAVFFASGGRNFFGSVVLSYDCYSGSVERPAKFNIGPDLWDKLTAEPRRYRLHATLKAPFHHMTLASKVRPDRRDIVLAALQKALSRPCEDRPILIDRITLKRQDGAKATFRVIDQAEPQAARGATAPRRFWIGQGKRIRGCPTRMTVPS